AQSDIEARMSQLSDGIQKMLHTNREGDSRGQGLSQQTLHHLETLQSQQLQLQSQLLESAIKIVRGHDSVSSDSKSAGMQLPQLRVWMKFLPPCLSEEITANKEFPGLGCQQADYLGIPVGCYQN
ncbi:hypothetical protein XENORESO_010221, partial [Xenotaenia resolanae]